MSLTPKERYIAIVDELSINPNISQSRKSISSGLRVNGKVFAMLAKGKMVVKLPLHRVDTLIDSGQGERYMSGGRPMNEWVTIEPASEDGWMALVKEAMDFVASQSSEE